MTIPDASTPQMRRNLRPGTKRSGLFEDRSPRPFKADHGGKDLRGGKP